MECPDCHIEMDHKHTFVMDDDACGGGCCRAEDKLYQCPQCKRIEVK